MIGITLVNVGEAKVEALLHTGESFNYVHKIIWDNLSPKLQLSPVSSQIQSATWHTIHVLGAFDFAVEIDGHEVVANFLFSNNITFAMILDVTFLKENEAMIDYANKSFTIHCPITINTLKDCVLPRNYPSVVNGLQPI